MIKPVIGIVTALTAEDHNFEPMPAYRFEYLKQQYYEVPERHGAVVIGLPATTRHDNIDRYLDLIDGLLLVGGEDVHPQLYDEDVDPLCHPMPPRRDQLEIELVKQIVKRDLPLLGICRGMQILNIACGGTLHQDLSQLSGASSHVQQGECDFTTRHKVTLTPDTRLHRIVGEDSIETNTGHHQGVKDVGQGLVVTARAADGVVEGLEHSNCRFVVGVQWHPEAWDGDSVTDKLVGAFCSAASATAGE